MVRILTLLAASAILVGPTFGLEFGSIYPNSEDTIEVQNCQDSSADTQVLKVTHGTIKPSTVVLGEQITVDIGVKLAADVGSNKDLILDLTVKKRVSSTWVKMPCLNSLGSCKYDVCNLIGQKAFEEACQTALPNGKCECPLEAGAYEVNGAVVEIPNAPGLESFLKGDYMLTAQIYESSDAAKPILGCIAFNFTITA